MGLFGGSKFDRAFEEYEMPQQGFWQGGDKFRGRDAIAGLLAAIGDGLMAQGGIQPSAAQGLLGGRADAMEMARKKAEEQAALAQQMAIARQAFPDMNDAQAAAIVQKIGNPSDFKPEAPPPMVRDVEAWQRMTPEQKAAAGEMYSTRSPWRVMGADKVPYDMGNDGLPDILTDDDINKLSGGDTGNGVGGFPPRRRF